MTQSPTHSPVPPIPLMGMDFPEAIRQVIDGKKITKVEWTGIEIYGVLKDGILQLHKQDGFHSWVLSEGDLRGKDWIVFREKEGGN